MTPDDILFNLPHQSLTQLLLVLPHEISKAWILVLFMQRSLDLRTFLSMVSPELAAWTWRLFLPLYGSFPWSQPFQNFGHAPLKASYDGNYGEQRRSSPPTGTKPAWLSTWLWSQQPGMFCQLARWYKHYPEFLIKNLTDEQKQTQKEKQGTDFQISEGK